MSNIVILYSGGLDSLMMERLARREFPNSKVTGIFFDHGQDSLKKEIESLPAWVKVKKIDWLGEEIKPKEKKSDPFAGAIYIPGRNLVFCVLSACYYQPDEIWLGVLADEDNRDATDKNVTFVQKTEDVLRYVLSPFTDNVRIRFPLAENGWTKTDALKSLFDSGHLTRDDVLQTSSCWFHFGEKPCGGCKQCLKRALVLRNFDIEEEHEGLHPLDPNNRYCSNLISGYLQKENPNADERAMQRLIAAFYGNTKFWFVGDL